MLTKLTENNFLKLAMQHYDNPSCTIIAEFEDDLRRFLYLKKLFTRYGVSGDLRERLILNHIIVVHNLWGEFGTEMIFYKLEEEHWSALAPFLIYLGRDPEFIPGTSRRFTEIDLDITVVGILREI
jgi:hypothetical protein